MDVTIAMALRAFRGEEKNFFRITIYVFSVSLLFSHSAFFLAPSFLIPPALSVFASRLFEMATRVNQFYLFRWLECFLRWILFCKVVGKKACRHKLHRVRPRQKHLQKTFSKWSFQGFQKMFAGPRHSFCYHKEGNRLLCCLHGRSLEWY